MDCMTQWTSDQPWLFQMDMFVGIHLHFWWTFPGHKKISWRKAKGNLGKQSTQFLTWDTVDSYIAAILGALRYTARVSVSTTDLQQWWPLDTGLGIWILFKMPCGGISWYSWKVLSLLLFQYCYYTETCNSNRLNRFILKELILIEWCFIYSSFKAFKIPLSSYHKLYCYPPFTVRTEMSHKPAAEPGPEQNLTPESTLMVAWHSQLSVS